MNARGWSLAAFTAACALAAILLPRTPQPLAYHLFADQRTMCGVPNFLDVASNAVFLAAGAIGLAIVVMRGDAFARPVERIPYAVFFAGLVLTAFGSAWYHLDPGNARLVWDRLPITVALAGLLMGQVADRIGVRAALVWLAPALAIGIASVVYWDASEGLGRGNVVPYVVAQTYAVLAIVLIAALYPSRYTRAGDIWWVFAWFVVARVCELLDRAIFDSSGGLVSGHTLKHVTAGISGLVVCAMLARREAIRR